MEALSVPIAEAIEKAVEKAMERIAGNICESLARILSNQMAQMCGTAENNLSAPRNISESSEFAKEYDSATPQQATEALHIRDSPEISKKYGSETPQQPTATLRGNPPSYVPIPLYTQGSTVGSHSQATTTGRTIRTSSLRSDIAMLPPQHAAQNNDAARHPSGDVPIAVESEQRFRKALSMVCPALALIALLLLLGAFVLYLFAASAVTPTKLLYPLVCTVSTNYSEGGALPRDGLCGYIFYESLYKDGDNSLTGSLSPDVLAFADLASHNNFTEFGMSFAIE
ncbi:hypothetical protein HPB51_027841 [Rhipicephalus microplus]|uniref:Uncharacterized protein n=1 Tax=Rhipicephalus microplus TaxID=6941 RepID=A0A9J6CZ62_RHIMP|nr:hypothetical protein HPB51_027841 [Rhipicephalus microplus]